MISTFRSFPPIIGSPSKWNTPSFARCMMMLLSFIVLIRLFWSSVRLNNWNEREGTSSTVNGSSTVMSIIRRSERLVGRCSIVAILRCIGTGYQECFVAYGTRRVFYFVRLRLIRQAFVQGIFQVGQQTSFSGIGKFQAHEGIESHSACAEEGWLSMIP